MHVRRRVNKDMYNDHMIQLYTCQKAFVQATQILDLWNLMAMDQTVQLGFYYSQRTWYSVPIYKNYIIARLLQHLLLPTIQLWKYMYIHTMYMYMYIIGEGNHFQQGGAPLLT